LRNDEGEVLFVDYILRENLPLSEIVGGARFSGSSQEEDNH